MNQSIVQPRTSPYCKPFFSNSTKKTENDASNITYSSEDDIIKKFKRDLEKSESDISAISTKANFGGAIDSSNIYSSWDESSTTETTALSSGNDSEDELIKEFRKDLELSKRESDSEDSSHSNISVIEKSGIFI